VKRQKIAVRQLHWINNQLGGFPAWMPCKQQSMELATEERRQHRLAALAAALRRVKSGDYGYCLKCDDKIAAGRLAVDPAVTLCIDCA
jgi:RNA polymerase-binding transcription factor DksA